jgi:phospholipase D-like protein/putative oligomerization/nucleic acid binding protein
VVAANNYPFLDVMWTFIVFFAWVIWFWILITVLMDLYRRHDVSGWGKAGWTVFVIVLPFLGVLIYLIAYGKGMAERQAGEVADAQQQTDAYIRSVAASSDPAEQIAKGKQLLDSGAITAEEFDALKRRALAS